MWRTYWIGFATLGWSSLLLTYAPWVDQRIGQHLLGPNLLVYVATLLHRAPPGGGGGFQSVPVEMLATTTTGGGFGGGGMPWFLLTAYRRIGASLEALVWAFAGGWIACYLASRRGRDDLQPVQPAAASHPGGPGS